MRIRLTFSGPEKIVLPVQYNRLVQAMIYNNISEDLAVFLHEDGYLYGSRRFKLFTFSRLEGRFHMRADRKIEFTPPIFLTVASPIERFLRELSEGMMRNDNLNLIGQRLNLESIGVYSPFEEEDLDNEVVIKMLSPAVAYSTKTEEETNGPKTWYYSPWDDQFSQLITDNLAKKYELINNNDRLDGAYVDVIPLGPINQRLCKILNYKGTVIKGWLGTYKLAGDKSLIKVAYDTGLGSKNPQGFGCFEIMGIRR